MKKIVGLERHGYAPELNKLWYTDGTYESVPQCDTLEEAENYGEKNLLSKGIKIIETTLRMKYEIKDVLIKRDGISPETAEQIVSEARDYVLGGLASGELTIWDIEDYLSSEFGLEPDYIDDLILI